MKRSSSLPDTLHLCPFALALRQGTALRLLLSSSKGQGERASVPSPPSVRTEPVEVPSLSHAGFDKPVLSPVEGLSPNGLFSLHIQPFTVRTEPVEVPSRANAGFDKRGLSGLFASTAKA
jgi:hypothetical protein